MFSLSSKKIMKLYCFLRILWQIFLSQYKDAFLSANPNFRWYKLPAPPLRTLMPRPTTATKVTPPLSSPSSNHISEFTPGKLADESQLGGLTSLMNNNFTTIPKTECCTTESTLDNNNHKTNEGLDAGYYNTKGVADLYKRSDNLDRYHSTFVTPVSHAQANTPPKPLKKRFFDYYSQNKGCVRNILPETREEGDDSFGDQSESSNMTKQDLVNKVSWMDGRFYRINVYSYFRLLTGSLPNNLTTRWITTARRRWGSRRGCARASGTRSLWWRAGC